LGEDAAKRRAQDKVGKSHVLDPGNSPEDVFRVQGRQYEMTRQRRLHGYLGSLVITDLPDQDHVRVGAQDRPQPAREGEACPGVYLDLIDAVENGLDWILDRHDRPLAIVELFQRGVERGRLATAGRPAHDDRAR